MDMIDTGRDTNLPHHEQQQHHQDQHLETLNQAMPRLITTLSVVLERAAESNEVMTTLMRSNTSSSSPAIKVSAFQGLTRPTISILSYLERIFKYANCSSSCLVVAYVYLDRFSQRQPLLPINSFNVHRLLITSVMVAAKFMDDLYYNNAYYAKIGGISTAEMNFLELDFLFGLGFNLNVTPNTFNAYCYHLQREMVVNQLALIQCPPPHHHHHQLEVVVGPTTSNPVNDDDNVKNYCNSGVVMPKFQSCFITSADEDDSSSSNSATRPQPQQHYLAV